MERQGIPQEYFGLRNWLHYREPFSFNIVVNDMREVKKHNDAELPRRNSYDVKSSSGDWGYSVTVAGKRKGP